MILPQTEKFICLSYPKIKFLFSHDEIVTAVSSEDVTVSAVENENHVLQMELGGTLLPAVDFDEYLKDFCNEEEKNSGGIKTAVILKNKNLFDETKNFVLRTSAECRVITKNLSEFSLFSPLYAKELCRFGITACYFKNDIPHYLLDINDFLKHKIKKTER